MSCVICTICYNSLFTFPTAAASVVGVDTKVSPAAAAAAAAQNRIVASPCGHLFHKDCLRDWIQAKEKLTNAKLAAAAKTCPDCGKLISGANRFVKINPAFVELEDVNNNEKGTTTTVALKGQKDVESKIIRNPSSTKGSPSYSAVGYRFASLKAAKSATDLSRLPADQFKIQQTQNWQVKQRRLEQELKTLRENTELRKDEKRRLFNHNNGIYERHYVSKLGELERGLAELNRDAEIATHELETKKRNFDNQTFSASRQREWDSAVRDNESKKHGLDQRKKNLELKRRQVTHELGQERQHLERERVGLDVEFKHMDRELEIKQWELFEHMKARP